MDKKYQYLEWNEENKKNFWDYESQFNERYFTYRVGDVLVRTLAEHFPHAKTALDYGSGRGHLIRPLVEQNLEVSTLEFSERAIRLIKEQYGGTCGFNGVFGLNEIDSLKRRFDLIFLVEIIEHLRDNELDETMKNIKNLLSDNGIAVITAPNDEKLDESMVCCPECQKIFHRWQHIRNWNRDSLKMFLEAKGFSIIDIFVTDLNLEKRKQKFTFRQKFIYKLSERDRRWEYKPHLISLVKKY